MSNSINENSSVGGKASSANLAALSTVTIVECESPPSTSLATAAEPSVRRQTSLGDYFPAELAVKSSSINQPQGKRRQQQQQQQPPPRHRNSTRSTTTTNEISETVKTAVASGNQADDSGIGCDVVDIEEKKLRDCLALAFTSARQQQLHQQHHQQQQALITSQTVASQAFNDSFGLAKLAAVVDNNASNNSRQLISLSSQSTSDSSLSSSAPSTPPSSAASQCGGDGERQLDPDDKRRHRDSRGAAASAGLTEFGDSTEENLFHSGGSLFESTMFSPDSPSNRPCQQQHQHRPSVDSGAVSTWRRRCANSHDERELFVGNLAAEVTEEDLVKIFSEFGPLKSVGIAKDSGSGACKGFGFLSFQQPELAEAVLESPRLFTLYGRVLRVDWRLKSGSSNHGNKNRCCQSSPGCVGSSRLKNANNYQDSQRLLNSLGLSTGDDDPDQMLQSADDDQEETASGANANSANNYGECQLFVGNLASDVTQGDLRQYFRRWGELLYCYVIRDEVGQSKRYGFITFKDPKVAEQLMQSRSSHVLKGKRLRFEMPKRSREEAFSLRQQDASSSSTPTPKASPSAAAVQQSVGADVSPIPAAGLDAASDQLPMWLHMRLMSDKDHLILCLRKELGLCGLLADRRMREINQAREREAQVMRVYVQQLEAQVKAQTAELDTLRHQLECRGEQVKLLTAKTEALAVEIVKAWGCAAATAAAAGGRKDDQGGAAAAPLADQQQKQQQQQQQQQQKQQYHHQHRLRPDSGIGL